MMITKSTTTLLLALLLLAGCGGSEKEPGTMGTTNRNEGAPAAATITPSTPPGFVHTVFFWLREDITDAEREAFLAYLNKLKTIEVIRTAYIGRPAGTPREVVDNTYDYAWIVHFDNAADQDAYQVHPVHLQFVEAQQSAWTRVQVYDTVVE